MANMFDTLKWKFWRVSNDLFWKGNRYAKTTSKIYGCNWCSVTTYEKKLSEIKQRSERIL